ncbi:MAG: hypothetical protein OEU91_08415 [Gammaproteobacteria bacterium]|nr:hypothetical protein [Gammaproteobacteria bacterium]
MSTPRAVSTVLPAVWLTAMFWHAVAWSQPTRDRLLDCIDVQAGDVETRLQINMTIPVRYVSHFPHSSGNELRVKLIPVVISQGDRDALFARESLAPVERVQSFLKEVIYEGDIEGGPYLTLLFARSVHFSVEQGRDSRSIVVRITAPAAQPK